MAFPHFRIPKISSSMSRDGEVSKANARVVVVGRTVAERNERERERDDGAAAVHRWQCNGCFAISFLRVDVEQNRTNTRAQAWKKPCN